MHSFFGINVFLLNKISLVFSTRLALLVIVLLLWLMAATRICFLLGSVLAFITSIIATIQFFIFIKSSYSRHIGNNKYKEGPEYQMPFSLYIRQIRDKFSCNQNRIANHKHEEKDTMNEHIPEMHRPL